MRSHLDLAREFGQAPWFNQTGSFEWWTSPQSQVDQRENFSQMKEWGYGVEWIEPRKVKELEPDINVEAVNGAPILYYPEEGWVDPALYVAWLLRAANARAEVALHTGTRVSGLRTDACKVTGVRLDNGDDVVADAVVNCAGSWSADPIDGAPIVPMASTVGIVAFTLPVATTLRRQFHAEDLDVRPDGAGRIMIHKVSVDRTLLEKKRLDPAGAEGRALLDAAARYLPALAMTEIEAIRTTMRPIPAGDGLTCVGAFPQTPGYYLAVTHSGVTLAPYLGKAVAEEVVFGRQHPDLSEFRPARFFAGEESPLRFGTGPARKRGNEFN
ncbi:glycine/D-amino acid oxidase-like deaminating enzyme [Kaistia dalseonensis]|uniref:Glycine/D-amino acid oxidase-like deaminating enzyme n=2 Tax=Kaistia dalseonensis TaxID=410840 RepID=A0ABU0H517_9HYPH|nr:glycine/D-amino acid oxidase-like deaminating enzyme [Kaistia dalseonensis]